MSLCLCRAQLESHCGATHSDVVSESKVSMTSFGCHPLMSSLPTWVNPGGTSWWARHGRSPSGSVRASLGQGAGLFLDGPSGLTEEDLREVIMSTP